MGDALLVHVIETFDELFAEESDYWLRKASLVSEILKHVTVWRELKSNIRDLSNALPVFIHVG